MQSCLKIIFALLLLIELSCKRSITDPEMNTSQPGRRDYIWTEDTMKVSKGVDLLAVRMWGNKPDNIWISASGGGYLYNLWHYDGKSVSIDSVFRRIFQPWGIFGLSADDIWLASSNNEIWHYDGNQWSKFGTYTKPGYESIIISNFWGKSADNIYAVGFAMGPIRNLGIIMHYDGREWKFLDIPDISVAFNDIRLRTATNTYYIEAYTFGAMDSSKFYSLKDGVIKEIYVTKEVAGLNNIGDEVYFCIGKKVYKMGNQGFELWKDYSYQPYLNQIWGTSEENCFHAIKDGIAHYNGSNMEVLYKTGNYICEALIFEKEVFFLSQNFDNWLNIVIHGKLKEGNE